MTGWVTDWLRAFGSTLIVEAAVVIPLLRRREPRRFRLAAAVVLVNLATHPLVWFLFPGLAARHSVRVALAELFAIAVEGAAYAIILAGVGPGRAMLVSLAANATSVAVGLALRAAHVLA